MNAVEQQPTTAPHNLEAEQALLGAVLFDNSAYERLSDQLQGRHFHEPFHQRLFEAMEEYIRKGHSAEPIVLMERFRRDPAFEDLGGLRYLADLVDRAPPAANAPDYARIVYDLALRREVLRISGEMAKSAVEDAETEAREQIEQAEQQLYTLAETGASSTGFREFSDVVRRSVEQAEQAHARDGVLVGISTGLIDLDAKLGGLHKSDLLILAGRPSMGKTAMATNIAFHVARAGKRVAFCSLEMSAEQLGLRILSDVAGVPSDRIRKGDTTAVEIARLRDASEEIAGLPLHIDATGALGIAQLATRARRLKRRHGMDLLVVDYLQLVTTKYKAGSSRVGEVSEITGAFKALAKELDVPVLALSQLSRQVESREDKRPQLSDLRESGSIEQDADAVMFIYREAYYLGRAEPKLGSPEHVAWETEMERAHGLAEVIIGKQRHGPIGTVKLSFDEETVRFGNLAREAHFSAASMPPRTPTVRFSCFDGAVQ